MYAFRDAALITVFYFCVALPVKSQAAVKNKTGEAHFWGPLSSWGPPQSSGPLPPPVPPFPAQQIFPWLGLSDDRNVCTLEASILVVLDNPVPMPITGSSFDGPEVGVQPPPPPPPPLLPPPYFGGGPCVGPPGSPCASAPNAVRMGCADIATTSRHACTGCCKMASRYYGITGEEVYGVLINSAALGTTNPTTGSSFKRNKFQKRSYPLTPAIPIGPDGELLPQGPGPVIPLTQPNALPQPPFACGFLPCPTTKCMCCGPRRPFTGWVPPIPPPFIPQPIWPWQTVGQAPPSK